MTNDTSLVVLKPDQEKAMLEAFYNVPFGNSKFQIEKFVLSHESPERVYRQLCLELSAKYQNLKTYWYEQRRMKIELKKLEKKLKEEHDEDEKELIRIDIEEKLWNIETHDKLVHDGCVEFGIYYSIFEKMPKITREDFDNSEAKYWNIRLVRQAERDILQNKLGIGAGNAEALTQVGIMPHAVAVEVIEESEDVLKLCSSEYKKKKQLRAAMKPQGSGIVVPKK